MSAESAADSDRNWDKFTGQRVTIRRHRAGHSGSLGGVYEGIFNHGIDRVCGIGSVGGGGPGAARPQAPGDVAGGPAWVTVTFHLGLVMFPITSLYTMRGKTRM
jgi:hypothetical protein